jgi:hypothetical protein
VEARASLQVNNRGQTGYSAVNSSNQRDSIPVPYLTGHRLNISDCMGGADGHQHDLSLEGSVSNSMTDALNS